MMKTILYSSFYVDKDPLRYSEILEAVLKNLDAGFSFVVYFVQTDPEKAVINNILDAYKKKAQKTTPLIIQQESRPTFEEIIALPSEADSIKIIQNLDVHFDANSLNELKSLPWKQKNIFVALSRWDVTREGVFLLDRQDSADTWAWALPPHGINLPCGCGQPGIDNRAAYEFHKAGYKVINPSRDIKTYHLHQVKKNNYRVDGVGAVVASSICPEPYFFHPPQTIGECLQKLNT